MKNRYLLLILLFTVLTGVVFLEGCASNKNENLQYRFNAETKAGIPYPNVSFAVISDIHVFDPSVHYPESKFLSKRIQGSKLFLDSIPLLDCAIDNILTSGVRFVIVTGDLTKDGELSNHLITAEKFKRLTDAGIAVYVTPGNHDINNSKAVRYTENGTRRVPNVNADEFAQIYDDFGFNAAFARDTHSLSYAVEPVEGLWLLSLDACRHRESFGRPAPYASGKFTGRTINWITKMLREAHDKNKAVIVMMHHGVVEHYRGQGKTSSAFIVRDFLNFGRFLASWNVRVVFSGHTHVQDIARANYDGKYIYDVQTGATITPPCLIRYAELKNNFMNLRAVSLVDKVYPGTDFAEVIFKLHRESLMNPYITVMRSRSIKEVDYEIIANAIADANIAHYKGDENPAERTVIDLSAFSNKARFFYKKRMERLDIYWTDIPPADNNISLNLN